MVKNWSKIVLVSLLVIAIAAPAFATTARVRSLAGTGNYLSDDSNVFRWYSTLPSYANMVQAEIGTHNTPWYGIAGEPIAGGINDSRALSFNYACGEDAKWGTYRLTLNENAVDHPGFYLVNGFINQFNPGGTDNPATYNQTPINKWDLAGGWEIGETIVLGLAYTRSSVSGEDKRVDPVEKFSSSWSTYGLGFTWTNNEDMILDATFTYASAGGEWTEYSAGEKVEWDKSTGMEFGARFFWDWKDYVTLVPVFEYVQAEYATKRSPTAWDDDEFQGDKDSGFMLGVAFDIEVNGSNSLIWATEYVSYTNEVSRPDAANDAEIKKTTYQILPVFRLALETEITAWLTTRIGATHSNWSSTQTNGDGDLDRTDGDLPGGFSADLLVPGFGWYLGAGFNVAEWTIDMELAPETPFSMGWWLHGYSAFDSGSGNDGPIGRISAVYNF